MSGFPSLLTGITGSLNRTQTPPSKFCQGTVPVDPNDGLGALHYVTAPAAERLLERAGTPGELMQLGVEQIQELIYPAGFYRVKAKNLKEIARIIAVTCGGTVPHGMDALLALPGVGRKTANLVRNLGFGLPGICVDTHVHRISNRTGWVCTKNPNQTEKALEQVLPNKYWVSINGLLVRFGKSVCTPVSPFCSRCPLPFSCPRVGVARMR